MRKTLFLVAAAAMAQNRPAVPVEPVGAIVEAFRSHAVVALGNVEFRGNEQSHAFQMELIRDPRFLAVANDIVVEFGNSRYQDVVDRFVRGEEVQYDSLRRVWRDTTQVEYEWDLPIYEDFFRGVRAVNAALPRERQLRVLLGDPPIDWEKVHSKEDLLREMGDRDAHALGVLRREVLDKGRRALVIYGSQHIVRRNTGGGMAAGAFTIFPATRRDLSTLQADAASWRTPSLAMLRGTGIGAAVMNGARLEEQFDAVLYLGPASSMTVSKLAPALCADGAYLEMRLGRLGLIAPPGGASFPPADQLRKYCAAVRTSK